MELYFIRHYYLGPNLHLLNQNLRGDIVSVQQMVRIQMAWGPAIGSPVRAAVLKFYRASALPGELLTTQVGGPYAQSF